MRYTTVFLLPALLTAALLSACGEKAEAPAPEAAPVPAAVPAAEPAPAKVEPGGYEPTPEERVQGITLTQEEIDKKYAEARAATPQPVIPGEAPAAPVAEEAPATEAK
ncbi:MAG TPA: hypothetical protein DCO68_08110 [Methylophilaceae bacterium]|nr:hypothetical protein [Methylophilaceae bacterium]HAJ72030.1 hypothetical protein [Methylophilaceae bacterium]